MDHVPNSPRMRSVMNRAVLLRALILLGIGLTLLWWTWGKLGDGFIDFGRELYLAWRASDGAVLYRDIEYQYGPLSVWINATWFRLLGVTIRTLVLCNAAILAAVTVVLYCILRRFSAAWSATVACALFLILFGFGNFTGFSNYNFLTPYAHGMTHGIALLLLGVLAILRWIERPRPRWIALAGAMLGLCIFTKQEIAVAAIVTLIAAVLVGLWALGSDRRTWVRTILLLVLAAIVVIAAVTGLMLIRLTPEQTLRGLLTPYAHVFDPQITQTKFYRFGMGIEHPTRSLIKIAVWCSYYGRVLVPAALVALLAARWTRASRSTPPSLAIATALGLVVFAAVWKLRFNLRWEDAFRGMTGMITLIDVLLLVALIRARRTGHNARLLAAAFIVAILATALLPKILLNLRIYQYGFVLAMPCVILAVVALLDWCPRLLERTGGDGRIFAGAVLGLLAGIVAVHLQVSSQLMQRKDVRLAIGADTIFASGEDGRMRKSALDELRQLVQPAQTLAVMPEAAILNYLLRTRNSTPFDQLTPITARVFGEDRITRAFRDQPPDWITLVHQDTSVFGGRYLGHDYLRELRRWIDANYVEQWQIGERPLQSLGFGISILRKTPGSVDLKPSMED